MNERIVARWQDWSGQGLEHLVLHEGPGQIVADAVVLKTTGADVFAARYRIVCDETWRVSQVTIAEIGHDRPLELAADHGGNWIDGSGGTLPQLRGAIDIDLSITPLTNTLPIRRLNLQSGESAEITAVYIELPGLVISTDRQRYTCLQAGKRYLYESLDSDFKRAIDVDDHGLVVTYPGLFRRVI